MKVLTKEDIAKLIVKQMFEEIEQKVERQENKNKIEQKKEELINLRTMLINYKNNRMQQEIGGYYGK